MQNNICVSSTLPQKCRCCLSEGYHDNEFDSNFFRKCLNLAASSIMLMCLYHTFVDEPRLPRMVCGGCSCFMQDVLRFRNMVLTSHQQLLAAIDIRPAETYIQHNEEFEQSRVKTELELKEDGHSLQINSRILDNTDCKVDSEFKEETESTCDIFSDAELFESKDFDTDIKMEFEESAAKVKRKRKSKLYNRNKVTRKKRKKYDSESDTPISLIKERKKRLKNKLSEESPSKLANIESRKHSFADNNKIRSNILLILKHSTVLPFRNNFKSAFKCFYCDQLYIPFKELKQHIEKEHSDVSEATIVNIIRSLQNLIVTAHIGCIKCKICDEEFKSIENLVDHLCNYHKKIYYETDRKPSHGILGVDLSSDTLKCHICNKDFAFFKNLSMHMNEHYGAFVCYVCGKKFLSEHRYRCHEFKAHASKETKCKHCGLVFKTEPAMTYHIRKEHTKGTLKCLKCPETFPFGQYVKRLNHMAEMHGIEKPKFKCDSCGKEYANSGSLAAHKRYTHKGIRELRCEVCGYITVHKSVMKNHMDFHNGVKNYECEFCKKKFGKPYTLKLHMKIHLNDKRFVCSLCDAAFIQKNSLKSHLKSRHPDSGVDISKL